MNRCAGEGTHGQSTLPDRPVFVRDDDHRYWLGQAELPGVTRVLEQARVIDYTGVAHQVLHEKALLGKAVHDATWFWDEQTLDPASVNDELQGYLDGWMRFRAESGFHPVKQELPVYSERHGYAGTLDRLGYLPGKVQTLVDLKVVRTLQPATGPQTAAYQQAAQEMGVFEPVRRFAVQLLGGGAYRVKEYSDPRDFSIFLNALSLWAWTRNH